MKRKLMIIFGVTLIVIPIGTVLINQYVSERELELNNTPGQLEMIFGLCDCYADPQRTCPQPFVDWENSTHYIDNNICKWREKEG